MCQACQASNKIRSRDMHVMCIRAVITYPQERKNGSNTQSTSPATPVSPPTTPPVTVQSTSSRSFIPPSASSSATSRTPAVIPTDKRRRQWDKSGHGKSGQGKSGHWNPTRSVCPSTRPRRYARRGRNVSNPKTSPID